MRRLIRISTASDIPGHGHVSAGWMIDGTGLLLSGRSEQWRITTRRGSDRSALQRWLSDSQLAAASFGSRSDALRAFEAAAAVSAPPASRPLPKLHRRADGTYRHHGLPQLRVMRVQDGKSNWKVTGLGPRTAFALARTLPQVAIMLAEHIETVAARARETA